MQNNIREIREKSIVFTKTLDVDLDFQENLMSYNDDMLKIVRCCVNNFVVSTDCKNGNITIYGKSKIYLTYISESTSCLTTADFEEEFQRTIPLENNSDDVTVSVKVINKYNNFRVINQRRIDIHNSFALDIRACAVMPVNMVDESENLLIRRDRVSYFSFIGSSFSKADFEENVEIPSDSEVIRKIINSFSSVNIEETKIITDKMLVKAKIMFSFLYTTDTDNEVINKCERTFSISKIVEIDGIDENDIPIVNVDIGNLYVKPKTNKNNELRFIEALGDVNISASVFRSVEMEVATDCYATDNEVVNTFGKLSLNANGRFIRDVIDNTLVFEFENIQIVEVLDVSLSIIDRRNIELSAYVMNENSEVMCISKRHEIENADCQMCSMYVKSFDYVIKSEHAISVRYSIDFSSVNFEERVFSVLSDAQITDNVLADSPALVVYFAKEQERIWDIAKKFRTSVDLIKAENELMDDVLSTRRVLLIPGM